MLYSHSYATRYRLEDACKHRNIPDCEFFINKRDYPHLKVRTGV